MRKTKINLRVGSTEDFFDRLREHAKKLDRGEALPPGITITFEDPRTCWKFLLRKECDCCVWSKRHRSISPH